jgi:hypothetical protein
MSGMADESRELRAFEPALVLLAICGLISYVDRGNLSIAAPLLGNPVEDERDSGLKANTIPL